MQWICEGDEVALVLGSNKTTVNCLVWSISSSQICAGSLQRRRREWSLAQVSWLWRSSRSWRRSWLDMLSGFAGGSNHLKRHKYCQCRHTRGRQNSTNFRVIILMTFATQTHHMLFVWGGNCKNRSLLQESWYWLWSFAEQRIWS